MSADFAARISHDGVLASGSPRSVRARASTRPLPFPLPPGEGRGEGKRGLTGSDGFRVVPNQSSHARPTPLGQPTGIGAIFLSLLLGLNSVFVARGAEPPTAASPPTLVLVRGAVGEADYATNFTRQADLWNRTAARAQARLIEIGTNTPATVDDRDLLRQTVTTEATNSPSPLWLVLIGHGTFDGKEARYNLRGPDVTATELADWLKPVTRPLVVIDATASSAPFLARLAGTNRVVISATRSGHEQSFARFGGFLAEAFATPASDLDQDGQISLLEAFLTAAHRVTEWYKTEGRLATEHALIDDNGDGLGTPADWFRGVRAVKQAQAGASLDGARAQQIHLVLSPEEQALPADVRARRDALELKVLRLRETKASLKEDDYYQKIEPLLLELAGLQESVPTNAVRHP